MKACNKCAVVKDATQYYVDRKKTDGRRNTCKQCDLIYYENVDKQRRSSADRKVGMRIASRNDYLKNKAVRDANEVAKGSTPYGRAYKLFASAKRRAAEYGLEFTLNFNDIHGLLVVGVCQRSGLIFDLKRNMNGFRNPFAPSLDRLDNTKGYTTDNVEVVCNMFNSGKGESPAVDFIAMCCAVAERHASDPAVIQRLKELRNAQF